MTKDLTQKVCVDWSNNDRLFLKIVAVCEICADKNLKQKGNIV